MVAWGEGAEAAAVACRMLEVAPAACPDSRDDCRACRRARELLAAPLEALMQNSRRLALGNRARSRLWTAS
jgi:hypothetical protein